ncbi:MAG: glycoside hydrolase family 140 protein, partial [Bacteroidales bacterium]|nr:glycoside hydrolase family 140 protein [Bacteroidales bacterium]
GGDRNVHNDTVFQIWKAMAQGLRAGDEGKHLITMHPRGEKSSSEWFHNEEWLDFNLYQSGHSRRFNQVYAFAQHDYLLHPSKPFVDGEPAYEDIAVRFWEYCDWSSPLKVPVHVLDSNYLVKDPAYFSSGFFTDYDVRIHAYWNLLSGAAGYTYGNNAIWQMFKNKESFAIPCLHNWRESLDRPGADDIRHVRKLFEARDFSKLIPDQSAIYGNNPNDSTHVRAAVASDGAFMIVYLSVGQKAKLALHKISGAKVKATWYNPREGESIDVGEFENQGYVDFVPPSTGTNNDWVLVLDDMSRSLPAL